MTVLIYFAAAKENVRMADIVCPDWSQWAIIVMLIMNAVHDVVKKTNVLKRWIAYKHAKLTMIAMKTL